MRAATAVVLLSIAAVVPGCATTGVVAGTPPGPRVMGYMLSGERVVFTFRPSDYTVATTGPSGEKAEKVQMSDLRVNRVSVAGEFNRWSPDTWPLTRSGDGGWVTTRPVTDFESTRELQFKFVVNGRFWAEPPTNASNRAFTPDGIANLVLKTDRPAPAEKHAQRTVRR